MDEHRAGVLANSFGALWVDRFLDIFYNFFKNRHLILMWILQHEECYLITMEHCLAGQICNVVFCISGRRSIKSTLFIQFCLQLVLCDLNRPLRVLMLFMTFDFSKSHVLICFSLLQLS